jgi:hypothetical protein
MSPIHHWAYLNAVEEDVQRLSRYIDLNPSNFQTHSIESARLLMTATQELDVVLKQICAHHGNDASKETGYRRFLPTKYPRLPFISVELPAYNLGCAPFAAWGGDQTPSWWTANNKVKHERHTHFALATVENMLESVAALFVGNVYLYGALGLLDYIPQGSRICSCDELVGSLSPTPFGMVPNYKLAEQNEG